MGDLVINEGGGIETWTREGELRKGGWRGIYERYILPFYNAGANYGQVI